MIRAILFLALAAVAVGYAFWVYLRVELPVRGARALAAARAAALVLVLLLLFDPRLPSAAPGGGTQRWVLLDASLSMSAADGTGATAWEAAVQRAEALEADGYRIVAFGDDRADGSVPADGPDRLASELAPALRLAAEAGVREVTVVSDLRFGDAVAVRSALEALPVELRFEPVGGRAPNAGIRTLDVSDVRLPDASPVADVEIFGGAEGDSVEVVVREEDREVARVVVAAPAAGRTATTTVELPPAQSSGRVRYTASLEGAEDAFPDDGEVGAYAVVGHEEGGLVLVSLRPDWEPRYLLPVLESVTGLSSSGFLHAGPDRWVTMGAASERGAPVDSSTVRTAAGAATLLVVHGLHADAPGWVAQALSAPGRHLVFVEDRASAAVVSLDVTGPQDGEWYASPDVPVSPIAGALNGIELQGLPPLRDVLTVDDDGVSAPLALQQSGAGAPTPALWLDDHEQGRRAIGLAAGYWRWAARPEGRTPYRQLWSGVVGWLLADQTVATAEPRPLQWVVPRGSDVAWGLAGSDSLRLVVEREGAAVLDTVVAGASGLTTPPLPPGLYHYATLDGTDTISSGRFDVAAATDEMLHPPLSVDALETVGETPAAAGLPGVPLRTLPWPYLIILALLCCEWIGRRRAGLR